MSDIIKENQDRLRDAGIVEIMNGYLKNFTNKKNFKNKIKLLDKVLETISALSDDDETRDEFIDSGLCDLVIYTVRPHLNKDKILLRFSALVVVIAKSDVGLKQFIKKLKETLNRDELEAVTEKIAFIAEVGDISEEYARCEDLVNGEDEEPVVETKNIWDK